MKKLKTPSLVTLAILTTITIVFWVFFSVYRVFASKPSAAVPLEILEPISPTLDSATLDKIQQGVYLPEENIPENIVTPPSVSPIPTLFPTPTPSSSPSASPTVSPEATPTGLEQGT